MREKFNPKDVKFIITCLLIGAASTFFALSYFRQAFPEASINLKFSKDDGRKQAEQFLANRGWDITDYIHASRFGYHWEEKTILERYFDAETAGRLYNDNAGYYWEYRWFKPEQKEEFKIELRTTGEIHFFEHIIADSTHGDSLSQDAAYDKAHFYITGTLGFDPIKWDLMEKIGTDRPNRYDHYFEWEEKDFYEKNGLEVESSRDENFVGNQTSHRISIDVRGSEISKYHEWFKHPESWKREYQNLRSYNSLAQSFGEFGINITLFIILMVIVIRSRKKDIHWKSAFSYGGLVAVLLALYALNRMPETLMWVESSISLPTMIFQKIFLDVILVPIFLGCFISIIIAGGEAYYRDQYPDQIAFRNIFSVSGLQTKYFFNSAVLGLTLTALFFGYQTLFYIISNQFGGWSPTEVKNINALGTYIPWIGVLLFGVMPAVSEEGISRLFSIPFLQKHTKSTFVAVFLSSLIWGLGHAGYPAQPFFIRVIEVGLGGIFISIIFLRFGILPALIWHFTIDAVYGAMILLRSDDAYMFTSGLLCAGFFFLPLAYSLASYLKNGGFASSDTLVNALDTGIPEKEVDKIHEQDTAKIDSEYKPLSSDRKKIGFIFASVSILLAMFITKDNDLDKLFKFNVTQNEAYFKAKEFLNSYNIDVSDYNYVIENESDMRSWMKSAGGGGGSTIGGKNLKYPQYFIEHSIKDSLKNISEVLSEAYTKHDAPHQWNVRFYKPGKIREYQIDIDVRNGNVGEYERTLADTTFLPSIDANSALIIAKTELEEKWGFNNSLYSLKGIKSEDKENRTDHEITFQSEEFVGKARYLYNVTIQGNTIGSVYKYFWIPEEWEREYEKTSITSGIRLFYGMLIWVVFSIFIFYSVLKLLKSHDVPWKYIFMGSLALVGIELIDYINESTAFMSGYDTEKLVAEHVVSNILNSYAIGLAFQGILWTIVILAAYMMWPGIYSSFLKKKRQIYLPDALATSFVAVGFIAFIALMKNLISVIFPNWISPGAFYYTPSETFFPAFGEFVIPILAGAPFWALIGIILFYVHRRYFSGKGLVLSNLIIILFLLFFANGNPTEKGFMLLPELLSNGIWFICFLILFRYFCRWNPWSYLLGIGIMWYSRNILAYMQHYVHPTFQIQGWIGIGIILMFFAYLTWLAFGQSSQKHKHLSA